MGIVVHVCVRARVCRRARARARKRDGRVSANAYQGGNGQREVRAELVHSSGSDLQKRRVCSRSLRHADMQAGSAGRHADCITRAHHLIRMTPWPYTYTRARTITRDVVSLLHCLRISPVTKVTW